MKNNFTILNDLSKSQRKEFENDLKALYEQCYDQMYGDLEKLKDVVVNINLQNEVFLNVIFEFDKTKGEKGKGRITHLAKYPDRLTYEAAVASEKTGIKILNRYNSTNS